MFVLGLRRREQGNLPLEDHSTTLLNLCLSKHGADSLGKEIKCMRVRWMKNSNIRGLLLSSPGMSQRARISAPQAREEAEREGFHLSRRGASPEANGDIFRALSY